MSPCFVTEFIGAFWDWKSSRPQQDTLTAETLRRRESSSSTSWRTSPIRLSRPHPVHSWRSLTLQGVIAVPQQIDCQMVQQRSEPLLLPLLGHFPHALQTL